MYHNAEIQTKDETSIYPEGSQKNILEKRQRSRLFHRLVTGMYYHRKKQFRFLTLTSGKHSPDIRLSWQELVRRIRNLIPARMALEGYIQEKDYDKYQSWVEPLKMEYFAVFTNEGLGVIHCVYAGDYIPFQWLQDTWIDIHNAYGVNIKKVKPFSKEDRKKASYRAYRGKSGDKVYYPPGLASYMLNQYLKNQSAIRTTNHSRGWVYPGFVKDWVKVKRANKKNSRSQLIDAWHDHLENKRYKQQTLNITPDNIHYAR